MPIFPRQDRLTPKGAVDIFCHTISDTKICELFCWIGFNGVMPTLAYVALNPLLASSSNMAELLWRKRLTTSRFTLITVCVVITAGLGYVDYLTGYEQTFLLFYLVPIGLGTWFG